MYLIKYFDSNRDIQEMSVDVSSFAAAEQYFYRFRKNIDWEIWLIEK
jgi:hypothetical protein